jgi:hypothetical protein
MVSRYKLLLKAVEYRLVLKDPWYKPVLKEKWSTHGEEDSGCTPVLRERLSTLRESC